MMAVLAKVLLLAAQPVAAAAPAAPASLGTAQELQQLRLQLPRAGRAAELLNAGDLADAMDYPAEAVQAGQQGTVRTWILVSAQGTVQRCGIEKSSGFPVLDAQTCDLITANAKFRPATGRDGRPIPGLATQALTWRLEEGRQLPMAVNSMTRETFVIGPDDALRGCTSQLWFPQHGKWIDAPEEKCREFARRAGPLLAAARAQSKLHDARIVFEARAFADPAVPMPPLADAPGDRLIYVRKMTMSFDSAGNRTSCDTVEKDGAFDFKAEPCSDPTFIGFGRMLTEQGVKADHVRLQWAVILKDEPR